MISSVSASVGALYGANPPVARDEGPAVVHTGQQAAAAPTAGALAVGPLARGDRARDAGVREEDGAERRGPEETESEGAPNQELSTDDKRESAKLAARDREVRAHEQAHSAAGGAIAGGPRYSYETGPDGRRYAVEGEVSIDVAPVSGDPKATIQKMRQVRRAALAPANPSATDRRVAAQAQRALQRAEADLRAQQTEARKEAQEAAVEDDEPVDEVETSATPLDRIPEDLRPKIKARGLVQRERGDEAKAAVSRRRAHKAYARYLDVDLTPSLSGPIDDGRTSVNV